MPVFSLSQLDRLRVMIIDNSPMMRDLVQSVLVSVGVKHFMMACDGRTALDMIPAFGPHLAFVDWEMEPMNGLQFVREVRTMAERDNPFLPIIMLTSHAEEPWVIEAKNAGVNDYLIKPVTGAAILKHLSFVINNPRPFMRTDRYFGPARDVVVEEIVEI